MKPDEKELLLLMYKYRGIKSPREIYNNHININRKRVKYLLGKLADKGLYDYGVALDLGWLTDKGIKYIEENLI